MNNKILRVDKHVFNFTWLVISTLGFLSMLLLATYFAYIYPIFFKLTTYKIHFYSILGMCLVLYFLNEILVTFTEELRCIREVGFGAGKLMFKTYWMASVYVDFADIAKVMPIASNWRVRQLEFLAYGKPSPGFDIVLKNGKRYHVTPYLDDVDGFKQELKAALFADKWQGEWLV